MNITVTASNGHQIRTTKGNANMDLFAYICKNLPNDKEAISKARLELSKLRLQARKIRAEIRELTGYKIML